MAEQNLSPWQLLIKFKANNDTRIKELTGLIEETQRKYPRSPAEEANLKNWKDTKTGLLESNDRLVEHISAQVAKAQAAQAQAQAAQEARDQASRRVNEFKSSMQVPSGRQRQWTREDDWMLAMILVSISLN